MLRCRSVRPLLIVAASALIGAAGVSAQRLGKFDPKVAGFNVLFHGESTPYRDAFVAAMPGAAVIFDVAGPTDEYTLETEHGAAVQQSAHQWRWTAPTRPGSYELKFKGPGLEERHDEITVHAFVMVPATEVKNGLLNGYRIGEYPATALKGNPIYLPPPGFVEITKENQDTKVSPHFTLQQFLCKEDTTRAFPKYVVLKERLPLKLEAVLQRVNELGVDADTLNVMSAFRTPYYNHAIGDVKYSLHQWGSAADVYVDPEKKNRMEDLNRDKRVDIEDAKFLYEAVERMLAAKEFRKFEGLLGSKTREGHRQRTVESIPYMHETVSHAEDPIPDCRRGHRAYSLFVAETSLEHWQRAVPVGVLPHYACDRPLGPAGSFPYAAVASHPAI
jgi:Peptidase M15